MVHAKRTARAFVDSTCWSRGCSSCRRPAVADRLPCSTGARRCANGHAQQPPTGCQGIRFHVAEGIGSPEPQETAVGPDSAIAVARPLRPCERGGGNNSPPLNVQGAGGSNRTQSGGSAVSGASSERLPAALRGRNLMLGPPRLNGAPLPSVGKECGCHAAASNGHKGMSLRGRWGRPKTVHRPDENRTIPYTNRTPPYTPTRVRDTLKTPAREAYAETVWHRPGSEPLDGGFLEYRLPQWMPAREQPAGMVIMFEKTMVLRQRPFRFGWGPFQSRTLPHKIRTHPHTAARVRER